MLIQTQKGGVRQMEVRTDRRGCSWNALLLMIAPLGECSRFPPDGFRGGTPTASGWPQNHIEVYHMV
jgi:hypothetical protein